MTGRRSFDAWVCPRGAALPRGPVHSLELGDVRVRFPQTDDAWIREVASTLRSKAPSLATRSAASIAKTIGTVGDRFLDPLDPIRLQALELLPGTSGLSPEMATAVLDGMATDWTEERLLRLLEIELGGGGVLDGFVPHDGGRVRAMGPGLCVQIVSGSVPGVGVTALIRSLLVKGPTLLKPGAGDVVLPVLFGRALAEVDPELSDAAAVVYWRGGDAAVEEAALAGADAITAYGEDDVVRDLRARAPATSRFVAYHHRVSVGVVGREALAPELLHRTASEVAGAVAFFDQRGCVSPHVVYVEAGGVAEPGAFAAELAGALAAVERTLPGGTLDAREASAIHQVRGSAELEAASGAGVEIHHGGDASWTVILDSGPTLDWSCVGRVVRVKRVGDVMDVPALVEPLARHLQTVGVAGGGERLEKLASALGRVGATRIAGFSEVPFPPPWWHHDGIGPLQALIRWVDLEG